MKKPVTWSDDGQGRTLVGDPGPPNDGRGTRVTSRRGLTATQFCIRLLVGEGNARLLDCLFRLRDRPQSSVDTPCIVWYIRGGTRRVTGLGHWHVRTVGILRFASRSSSVSHGRPEQTLPTIPRPFRTGGWCYLVLLRNFFPQRRDHTFYLGFRPCTPVLIGLLPDLSWDLLALRHRETLATRDHFPRRCLDAGATLFFRQTCPLPICRRPVRVRHHLPRTVVKKTTIQTVRTFGPCLTGGGGSGGGRLAFRFAEQRTIKFHFLVGKKVDLAAPYIGLS